MKEKVAITLDEHLLASIDALVENGVGKNRSQVIDAFLRDHMMSTIKIRAIVLAHDIKWDNGPYRYDVPKYLLTIDDKSVLFHQVKAMSQIGIKNISLIIATGTTELYKKSMNPVFPHLDIEYIEVDPMMKTGAALRSAHPSEGNYEHILVTNGDTYLPDLDMRDFLEYHTSQKSDWTFILKYVRTNFQKFWNVTINGNIVDEFVEKPTSPEFYRYLTNCGWYLMKKKFYDSLTYEGDHLEVDLFDTLPKRGKIVAYTYSKPWHHIQSDGEYEQAQGFV